MNATATTTKTLATTVAPTTAAITTGRGDGDYDVMTVGHGSNDGDRGH
jgi:hypothetical protein